MPVGRRQRRGVPDGLPQAGEVPADTGKLRAPSPEGFSSTMVAATFTRRRQA